MKSVQLNLLLYAPIFPSSLLHEFITYFLCLLCLGPVKVLKETLRWFQKFHFHIAWHLMLEARASECLLC